MYIEGNNLELNEDRIRFEGEQKEQQVFCWVSTWSKL